MERGPVFVAGLERSGTSLIFALLASHPNIAMTRRTNQANWSPEIWSPEIESSSPLTPRCICAPPRRTYGRWLFRLLLRRELYYSLNATASKPFLRATPSYSNPGE